MFLRLLRRFVAFFSRKIVRHVLTLLFSVRVSGEEHFWAGGKRSLIIANHLSSLDSFFLFIYLPEIPVFTVYDSEKKKFYIRLLLLFVEHIKVDLMNPLSIKSIIRALDENRSVVVFPEGEVSKFSSMGKVYKGVGLILQKSQANIIPVAIDGLRYCKLSGEKNDCHQSLFPKISLDILPPRKFNKSEGENSSLQRKKTIKQLKECLRDAYYHAGYSPLSLFESLVWASKRHGGIGNIVEDVTGTTLSYRQLITKVFALANIISQLSRTKGRVGIMLPNTCAAVITFFACHLLGKETCMLNYTSGAKGLTTAIGLARIELIISSRKFIDNANLGKEKEEISKHSKLVCLEDVPPMIGLCGKITSFLASFAPLFFMKILHDKVSPQSNAVILFTSGSEGEPKAVVLCHSNLLSNFAQVQMLIDLGKKDYILNTLPFFHCFGLMAGMILPLLGGTKVFEYPNPLHYRVIPELCYQKRFTCLWGTPTFLRGYGVNSDPLDMTSLRYVVSGAEKLSEEIYQLWNDRFGIRIFEGYGVTEASPVVATNSPLACKKDTVGPMVSQLEYYVRPVDGIEKGGELVIKGPNIMVGYLSTDDSSENLVRRPKTVERGLGWHATGDIVELDDEGFITIVGRIKRFAKIAGEMISLSVVEELASKLWPEGQHAAITQEDSKKGERIVLVTNETNATKQAIIQGAHDLEYGDFYIPREIKIVNQIPVLGSGKTNYTELQKLVHSV